MEQDIRSALRARIEHSTDPSLRAFANSSDLDFNSLLELIQDFADGPQTDPRYLRRGCSGAGVLLLVTNHGIARVVKFGPKGIIEREFTNFKDNIPGFISGSAVPSVWKTIVYHQGFASFAYTWAGDHERVIQIRDAFRFHSLSSNDIADAICALMDKVKPWHSVLPLQEVNPFDMWEWRGTTANDILAVLKDNRDLSAINHLEDFVTGTFPWRQRIDQDCFAQASRVHGDMNCHNIVLFGRIGRLEARLIDFETISSTHSPAYDWAKLERDLKFRSLRVCVDPEEFSTALAAVEETLLGHRAPTPTTEANKVAAVCAAIRWKYVKDYTNLSSRPQLEYLIFLLYRSLSFLATGECLSDKSLTRAFIQSCVSTHQQILDALENSQFLPKFSHPTLASESRETRIEQKTSSILDQRSRLRMLESVRLDCVERVLNRSLHQIARIELGLQTRPDAIEQALKAIVQTPDQPSADIPAGTTIGQIFDDHGGALLILGAPGTGKTTLLTELAKILLERAERDARHEIPVVFNLTSWAVRCDPLERWLVSELHERNGVPRALAQHWVGTENIIPLLDGLDEVAMDHRQACVEAINNFRRDHGLLPLAVCSRTADYNSLDTKLRLRSAVVVQSLSRSEVQDYLEEAGEPLQTLRARLKMDPSLWELLETPLMLWVAMLAYAQAPVEFAAASTIDQQRSRLFASFVDTMLNRRSLEVRYTPRETVRWLCWLAHGMRRKEQSIFYLETLNEDWLLTNPERWLSRLATILGAGLIGSMATFVISECFVSMLNLSLNDLLIFGLKNGTTGLITGLGFGLVGTLVDLRPVEIMRFSLEDLPLRFHRALRTGLTAGVGLGLITPGLMALMNVVTDSLVGWIRRGLIIGVLFGVTFGLVTLFFGEEVQARRNPNEGTFRSIKMALFTGLLFAVLTGLLGGLDISRSELNLRIMAGLSQGLGCGLMSGLIFGGLFSIRHLVLRLMLHKNRFAPLRYGRFLDYAVERLFLRQIGGGYVFIHGMLLEYFASTHE